MRFTPDLPITDAAKGDALAFNEFAGTIEDAITHTQAPFVFGILGDWGTGKTSILHLLQNQLNASHNRLTIPIWFNAWLYENEVNILYPLLHALKTRFEQDKFPEAETEAFRKSFLTVARSTMLAVADIGLRAITKHATGEAYSLKDVEENMKRADSEMDKAAQVMEKWTNEIGVLSDAYRELVRKYVSAHAARHQLDPASVSIVFLVDDLDRCLPEVTISILEGIKNFLAVENCVYVFAINPDVVSKGISIKYHGLPVSGREYLEKMLNYSFYVPPPASDKLAGYCVGLLRSVFLDAAALKLFELPINRFGAVVGKCQFSNPRKIKRLVNRYALFLMRHKGEIERFVIENIVRMLILAEYYPDLFRIYLMQEGVAAEFTGFGSNTFSAEKFETRTGLNIRDQYRELVAVKGLFEMFNPNPGDKKFASLIEHATAVHSLTHHR